jgi:uncharacterized protein YjeT (DUF2065 family)
VRKILEMPESALRRMGTVLMGIGLLLIYLGRT